MSAVQQGQAIEYRIKVLNRGDAAALNVVLTDVPWAPNMSPEARSWTHKTLMAREGLCPRNGLTLTDLAQIGDSIEVDEQHFFNFTAAERNSARWFSDYKCCPNCSRFRR